MNFIKEFCHNNRSFALYPKINSLFMRESQKPCKFTSEYARPEFALIDKWVAHEKIDGTNVCVCYRPSDGVNPGFVRIHGRTENAQLHTELLDYLTKTFILEKFEEHFKNAEGDIILYGEGYGPKIQNGRHYSDSHKFVLFDVKVGNFWLEQDNRKLIAHLFDIPNVPQVYTDWNKTDGVFTKQELIECATKGFWSMFSDNQHVAEGIVARTMPLLFNRQGERVMFKLKTKDFE